MDNEMPAPMLPLSRVQREAIHHVLQDMSERELPYGMINHILRRMNSSISSKDGLISFLEEKGNAVYNELLYSLLYGDVWDASHQVVNVSHFALRWNSLLPMQFFRWVSVFLPTDGGDSKGIVTYRPKSIFLDPIMCREDASLNGLYSSHFSPYDVQEGFKVVMVESFCQCLVFASAYYTQRTRGIVPTSCTCELDVSHFVPHRTFHPNRFKKEEEEEEGPKPPSTPPPPPPPLPKEEKEEENESEKRGGMEIADTPSIAAEEVVEGDEDSEDTSEENE